MDEDLPDGSSICHVISRSAVQKIIQQRQQQLKQLQRQKIQKKLRQKKQKRQPAAASETAETTEAAEENSELDLAAAAGKHHVEITVKDYGTINVELDGDAAPITVAKL